jgi:hypothetical protein
MLELLAYIGPGTAPLPHEPLLLDLLGSLGLWVVLSPLGLLAIVAGRLLLVVGHRVADLDPVHASPRGARARIR